MPDGFPYDVFLSHGAKDKPGIWPRSIPTPESRLFLSK
jgi:hypothetical protein